MSIFEEIKNRINNMEDGSIFMTSDFVDLASNATIRKCLSRCVENKTINRVFDGVYVKPKYSSLLKEYLPVNPEKIAHALASKYHWNIAPCGDIALNKLGLSTQVPVVYSYVSDGPYKEYSWNNIKLYFKHRANREISSLSRQTQLIVEALRALGKDNIDEKVINHLRDLFTLEEKKIILNEASECSEWIYQIIRKVCVD